MDSKKARKLKEGFLVKKVGKLPVNFEDIQMVQRCCNWSDRAIADQVKSFYRLKKLSEFTGRNLSDA